MVTNFPITMQSKVLGRQQDVVTNCIFNIPPSSIGILVCLPAPATNDAKPNHEFPTRLTLSLAQPVLNAYHPSGK